MIGHYTKISPRGPLIVNVFHVSLVQGVAEVALGVRLKQGWACRYQGRIHWSIR